MPNSYKIALALALLLCAVVTGSYLLRNGDDTPPPDGAPDASPASASLPDASKRDGAASAPATTRPRWASEPARPAYQPASEPGRTAADPQASAAASLNEAKEPAPVASETSGLLKDARATLARARADASESDGSEGATPADAAAPTPPRSRVFTVGVSPAASAGVEPADGQASAAPPTSTRPTTGWPSSTSSRPAATTPPTPSRTSTTTSATSTRTAAAAPSVPSTYTVKAGDTFVGIAKRLYGHERHWEDIGVANPSVDPQRLQVGQKLRMPTVAAVRQADATRDGSVPQDMSIPRHTVAAGETLTSIAQRHYADSSRWRVIYSANRSTIGTDPNRLKAGMTLMIPPAPTVAR